MKILIIDNYDSFTYNLYQYIGEILVTNTKNPRVDVYRNDAINLDKIKKHNYDKIVISPGPGSPENKAYFGVSKDVLLELGQAVSILGVCLGMQGMAYYFGGSVVRAKKPMHGKTSIIEHDGKGVFRGLPPELEVMRYHSLIVDRATLPDTLAITATAKNTGEIMGLRHTQFNIEGVQFHPESFATEGGKLLIKNFLFPQI